ncbi:MAG: rod-binding protein [Azospirillaceae bacterium]|nr:rod-binding protein [Azospirillaceae bacterium]
MSDEMKLSPPGYDPKALTDNQGAPKLSKEGLTGKDDAAVDKAAKDFESVFISQMLQHMWEGVEVDPNFGGGHAEEMFRGMMIEEQAKAITKGGGIGIAKEIKEEMVRMQEKAGNDPLHRPKGNAYAQAQAALAQHMPLDKGGPDATDDTSDETQ